MSAARAGGPRFAAIVLLLVLLAFLPTWGALLEFWWHSPTYNHGLLVVLVAAGLAWRALRRAPPLTTLDPLALAGTCAAVPLWLFGRLNSIQVIEFTAAVLIVFGMAALLFPRRHPLLLLLAPGLLMLLSLPLWNFLEIHLQRIAAHGTLLLLNASAIPAILEDLTIFIAVGSFHVAPSCSGLGQLLTMAIIAILLVVMMRLNVTGAVLAFVSALVLAVVSNVIRVYIIVMLGEQTTMQHPVIEEHGPLGWAVFSVFVVGYVLLFSRLFRRYSRPAPAAAPAGERTALRPAAVAVAVLPFALASYVYWTDHAEAPTPALAVAPVSADGWERSGVVNDGWSPVTQGHDAEYAARFSKAGREVQVDIRAYATQRQGKEADGYYNHPYDQQYWRALDSASHVVGGPDGFPVQRHVLAPVFGGQKRVMWYWYSIGDRRFHQRQDFYRHNFVNRLGARAPVLVLTVSTVEQADADELLREFIMDNHIGIQRP